MTVKNNPVAWMRRWYYEGEKEYKVKNEASGRIWIHRKFTLLPVTILKRLRDDIPLYTLPE